MDYIKGKQTNKSKKNATRSLNILISYIPTYVV